MNHSEISALHPGHVLRREVVNGKHRKHVIVKIARTTRCDTCSRICHIKAVKTQTTGNVTLAVSCLGCAAEEYK